MGSVDFGVSLVKNTIEARAWMSNYIPQLKICGNCVSRALVWHPRLVRFIRAPNDDVIKWKHFPRYWPFVRGIHRSPVNSPHKGQWRGALKFSLIYAWINDWVNNGKAGDLRRHPGHHDVTVMSGISFRLFRDPTSSTSTGGSMRSTYKPVWNTGHAKPNFVAPILIYFKGILMNQCQVFMSFGIIREIREINNFYAHHE